MDSCLLPKTVYKKRLKEAHWFLWNLGHLQRLDYMGPAGPHSDGFPTHVLWPEWQVPVPFFQSPQAFIQRNVKLVRQYAKTQSDLKSEIIYLCTLLQWNAYDQMPCWGFHRCIRSLGLQGGWSKSKPSSNMDVSCPGQGLQRCWTETELQGSISLNGTLYTGVVAYRWPWVKRKEGTKETDEVRGRSSSYTKKGR